MKAGVQEKRKYKMYQDKMPFHKLRVTTVTECVATVTLSSARISPAEISKRLREPALLKSRYTAYFIMENPDQGSTIAVPEMV